LIDLLKITHSPAEKREGIDGVEVFENIEKMIDGHLGSLGSLRVSEIPFFVAKLGCNVLAISKHIQGLAGRHDRHSGGISQRIVAVSGTMVNDNGILRRPREKTHVRRQSFLEPSALENDKPAVEVCRNIRVSQRQEFFYNCLETIGTGTSRL
jgi:hypothetical protein